MKQRLLSLLIAIIVIIVENVNGQCSQQTSYGGVGANCDNQRLIFSCSCSITLFCATLPAHFTSSLFYTFFLLLTEIKTTVSIEFGVSTGSSFNLFIDNVWNSLYEQFGLWRF